MSATSKHHHELDSLGLGKCSVPTWTNGCPDGFCDRDAFGVRPHSPQWMNYAAGEMQREDGRYNGYVPGLACHMHGGPEFRTFKDGNAWCAVRAGFVNLQESDAGFGDTPEAAIADLQRTAARAAGE